MTTQELVKVIFDANNVLDIAKDDHKATVGAAIDTFIEKNPTATGNDIKAVKAIAKAKASLKLEELQAYTETLNNQIGELS